MHVVCGCRKRREVSAISKIGRSAKTGQFTTVKTAKAKPSTHVVETRKSGK
jgi:hypothetical protein